MQIKKLITQFLKFGVVGVIAFVIDYGLYMLLSIGAGLYAPISAAISFIISLIFNYLASMRYVFTHRADLSRQKEFVIFLVLSAIGLGINEICVWGGVSLLGDSALDLTIAKLFATAIVMVWNFFSRKKWLDAGDAAVKETDQQA